MRVTRAGKLGGLVFVVVLLTFARICTHEFSDWDDPWTIHHNPRLNPVSWSSVKYYWTRPEYGLYMPGTYTVWAGLAKLAWLSEQDELGIQLNPWVFHTTSVLLHACGAVALFALLRRLGAKDV